ncbi:DUF6559 family protein [Neptunomonas concharum]|uniref:Uncharacterized protein n=1 Tax=Neptunomonas concharum TaxID=1031538 RepID=A0A5P1RCC9_9GAMM|nr:DUF6559 family protein [Neptunomonas concharum]QEQ96926.1 hypothetical protein F0U83_09450 [Neptunomonas concharum]
MLDFIANYKRNKAIKEYLGILGMALNKRYSALDQFTVMQIEKTITDLSLSNRFTGYAIAMYRHEESKNTIALYCIDQELLDLLRRDIADWFFNGSTDYRAQDIVRLGSPRGWRGGSPNQWVANQARIGAYHK